MSYPLCSRKKSTMTMLKRIGSMLLVSMGSASCLELGEQLSIPGVYGLVSSAEATVGRPLTPVSVAGVARNSTAQLSVEARLGLSSNLEDCSSKLAGIVRSHGKSIRHFAASSKAGQPSKARRSTADPAHRNGAGWPQ